MLKPNKIKIGVLGCASIAQRFLIPAINNNINFDLHGIASRSSEKAQNFAKNFKTLPFDSYESLIESGIDAIYIPLPTGLHYKWIKKSLENNLHVLVEKSMACSLSEVEELNYIAKSQSLVLLENFQFRFHKQLCFIKEKIDEGYVGEIQLLRSSFGFPPFKEKNNIRYQKNLGGGALLDAGAYTLKIAQIFLGKEIYVDSASLVWPKDSEVDIYGSGLIKQKNGSASAQVAFGFDNFYQNSLEIWGTKGRIFANRIFTAGPDFQPEVLIENENEKEIANSLKDDHFKNMLNFFSDLIINKENVQKEYNDNMNQGRLLHEFYEKSKT